MHDSKDFAKRPNFVQTGWCRLEKLLDQHYPGLRPPLLGNFLDLATTPALRATPPVPGGEPEFQTGPLHEMQPLRGSIKMRPHQPPTHVGSHRFRGFSSAFSSRRIADNQSLNTESEISLQSCKQ